ncbi:hypothetical protein RAZWK3B_18143 [Roseobacter sp. AzwK-3b]|nr:hypothetical protein RAZWK3B_18143 [Roseobacter sp. AzwK-3b]
MDEKQYDMIGIEALRYIAAEAPKRHQLGDRVIGSRTAGVFDGTLCELPFH